MSSSLNDPRERTLAWLNSHFTIANVTDDNGNSTHGLFTLEGFDFPVEMLFIDLMADYVVSIGDPEMQPIRNADRSIDSYHEVIPITVSLVDKADLTAVKVKWLVEREIRRVAETYVFGSVRQVNSRLDNTRLLGTERLHSFTYQLSYVRENI
jgi:hypothetical protein